jgi:hypothetical protein
MGIKPSTAGAEDAAGADRRDEKRARNGAEICGNKPTTIKLASAMIAILRLLIDLALATLQRGRNEVMSRGRSKNVENGAPLWRDGSGQSDVRSFRQLSILVERR